MISIDKHVGLHSENLGFAFCFTSLFYLAASQHSLHIDVTN